MRTALGLVALLVLATPALAQEQVLEGRLTRDGDDVVLVRRDGSRVSVPFDHRNEARTALCPLTGEVVRVGARVSGGTARVTRLIDPVLREVRGTVESGPAGLAVVEGTRRRTAQADEWTGPLLRHLVGTTVDLRGYVFASGKVQVEAVKGRARRWHFQPIVAAPILLLPRWRRPGTEYWVTALYSDGTVTIGLRHPAVGELDFTAPTPTPGLAGSVGR